MKHAFFLPLVLLSLVAAGTIAGELVPFRGTWTGSTVSAELISPTVAFVVSEGEGQATHLGRMWMVSPHYSHLDTGFTEGEQNFTAANGDRLDAIFSGQLLPNSSGCLEGVLAGEITGGTGRFDGSSGSYEFHILACPGPFGFDSTASIWGWISSPGAN